MPVSGFSIARRWSFYHDTMLLFSRSVMSDSLWPHGLQHARFPCPSPSTGACSNSRPFSQWCHPTISPSVVPFSSCPQSCPALGSFPVSQFFTIGGQSTEVSWKDNSSQRELILSMVLLVKLKCRSSASSGISPHFSFFFSVFFFF